MGVIWSIIVGEALSPNIVLFDDFPHFAYTFRLLNDCFNGLFDGGEISNILTSSRV